jgi:hypothetical protein
MITVKEVGSKYHRELSRRLMLARRLRFSALWSISRKQGAN